MTPVGCVSFALAMLVLAATPGPGVMATVASVLKSGFKPALSVVGGIIFGDLLFLLFAVFGLSLLAQHLGQAFFAIKIIGGGYLIYQGVKLFFCNTAIEEPARQPTVSLTANFFSGLSITLGNPKVILFYCGFLPNFIQLAELTLSDIVSVAGIVVFVLSGVLGSYAWLAGSARNLIQTPGSSKLLNRSAGTVMVTTGIWISSRS
jgi:threonine/homoserine/homoserine lactone efflux protein